MGVKGSDRTDMVETEKCSLVTDRVSRPRLCPHVGPDRWDVTGGTSLSTNTPISRDSPTDGPESGFLHESTVITGPSQPPQSKLFDNFPL